MLASIKRKIIKGIQKRILSLKRIEIDTHNFLLSLFEEGKRGEGVLSVPLLLMG